MSRGDGAEAEINPLLGGNSILNQALAEMTRGFDELNVIHCDESLQRSVRALAARAKTFARWSVESNEGGRGSGAFPESIETTTVERFAVVLSELGGVARCIADRFPDTFGLIWANAVPAHFFNEQAAHVKSVIANHFGVQTEPRAAGEKPVFRIQFVFARTDARALPIGGRSHQQPHEMLHIPRLIHNA